MDRKKKIDISMFVLLLVALLILVMMFLPGIVAKEPDGTTLDSISGTKIAFGYTESVFLWFTFEIEMNSLLLLGYLLPLLISIGLFFVEKFKPNLNKLFLSLLAITFLLTIIGNLTILSVTKPILGGEVYSFNDGNFKLGAGSVLGAILGFVGVGTTIYNFALLKK